MYLNNIITWTWLHFRHLQNGQLYLGRRLDGLQLWGPLWLASVDYREHGRRHRDPPTESCGCLPPWGVYRSHQWTTGQIFSNTFTGCINEKILFYFPNLQHFNKDISVVKTCLQILKVFEKSVKNLFQVYFALKCPFLVLFLYYKPLHSLKLSPLSFRVFTISKSVI